MPPVASLVFEVQPFGGAEGENVERFICQVIMHCRPYEPMFDELEIIMMRCQVLERNLQNEARRWYDEELDAEYKEDFSALSAALVNKYRNTQKPDKAMKAMRALENLR